MQTMHGRIISSQLSYIVAGGMPYGYIGLMLDDGTQVNVKIDVYTVYDTLAVGDHVEIEAKPLGNQGVLVAKRITYERSGLASSVAEDEEVSSSV